MEKKQEITIKRKEKNYQYKFKNDAQITEGNIEVKGLSKTVKKDKVEKLIKENTNVEVNNDHLCFNCRNAYPSKCPKIFDCPEKQSITEYSFVDAGYELYTVFEEIKKVENKKVAVRELRKLQRLVITGCKNFTPDKDKRGYYLTRKKNK